MNALFVFCAAVVGSTFAQSQPSTAYCNNNAARCPTYKVIERFESDGYELREYEPSTWITSNVPNVSWREAKWMNFGVLFNYIKAGNIPMTAPVTTGVTCVDSQCTDVNNELPMSFYVAPGTVTPASPGVDIRRPGPFRVYVRSYPGFLRTFSDWHTKAMTFRSLIAGRHNINSQFYYTAGYNSPYQRIDRHNEIWFMAN